MPEKLTTYTPSEILNYIAGKEKVSLSMVENDFPDYDHFAVFNLFSKLNERGYIEGVGYDIPEKPTNIKVLDAVLTKKGKAEKLYKLTELGEKEKDDLNEQKTIHSVRVF